ncbi:MAG: HAD family hydrolase [Oligoflexia bacterium]|nr:HAD family hydrolase [Oligoflexia bacterium]
MKIKNIDTIFFDFGGTLDSDGVHSRTLFFNALTDRLNLHKWKNKFQDAYSYADSVINKEGLVAKLDLKAMNYQFVLLIVCKLNQMGFLSKVINKINQKDIDCMANKITNIQAYYLRRNKNILSLLKQKKYRLGIISNFSGNLEIILHQFELQKYFKVVIDSYYLGVQKPDLKIFKEGLAAFNSTNSMFVGDNIERDIMPAKRLKMHTVLVSSSMSSSMPFGLDNDMYVINHLYQLKHLL